MKQFEGVVVGTKMKKTAMVAITRKKIHPIYKKGIKVVKKYPAHDEIGVKVGDRVQIQGCRPISKTKKWQVVKVLKI